MSKGNQQENTMENRLTEQVKTAYKLIGIMTPESEAEFIAVILPNLLHGLTKKQP